MSMATLTIRNLDENTKQALRERAARNGNSMEEEARIILGTGSGDHKDTVAMGSNIEADGVISNPIAASNIIDPDFPGSGKKILLIICGSVAAYKSLDLIRRLKERGVILTIIMTRASCEFISPLLAGALSHSKVYTDLFNRDDEHDVGHIRLAREADLIVVAPTSANMIAKMANGFADDLASAVLLAASSNILIAPAMNPAMWNHASNARNIATLLDDGIDVIGPDTGEMAESDEAGRGRMEEPHDILVKIGKMLDNKRRPLSGLRAILTAGPTHEPIDPVRYIANRSSGKQGYQIAAALARAGAEVDLVSGPVNLPQPDGVNCIMVETARQMHEAVETLLPADIAVMVAAVADWRSVNSASEKIKKKPGSHKTMSLGLIQNPDILKSVGHHKKRPKLVIGFAAETQNIIKHAKAKLERKGADWILANDVSPETGIMGGDNNTIKLLAKSHIEEWPDMSKSQVAQRLVEKIISHFETETISV